MKPKAAVRQQYAFVERNRTLKFSRRSSLAPSHRSSTCWCADTAESAMAAGSIPRFRRMRSNVRKKFKIGSPRADPQPFGISR